MNEQITIGGESMSFWEFEDAFVDFVMERPISEHETDREIFRAFLHTYTKKS